jgi:glucose-6-phosphate-specific signal transduction histidine kinase
VHLECVAPRLSAPTETTAYFIVAEALTNVAKHANASRTEVRVGVKNDKLSIESAECSMLCAPRLRFDSEATSSLVSLALSGC